MKEFEKTIMGKNIIVTAEKELEPQIESLFVILEQVDRNNLIHGFSIQVGWSVYYLHERETGNFILTSPDYSRNPFEDITEDLTLALWVQLEQGHFLRKINVDGLSIKFSDKIILCKGVLELEKIYLQRNGNVEKGDSGWYIGPVEEDNTTELYALYAYQLLKIKPEIIQVLALPNEYMVVFEGNKIKAVLNENDLDVFKDSI
ncbi:immunity protein Imm33 domain-containing protein [Psychrobacillus sp. FSL H8-0487]|uniref:immunity protein Imm33 domain-containing protein n=1 Tax=Psychrobacillus sp. FSL H8-0487 TaxID=2921391 RepID=UPI0030F80867